MSDDYEFRCRDCDHTWVFVGDKFSAMDVYDEPCPNCSNQGSIERSYVKDSLEGYSGTSTIGRKSGGYFNNQHALKQNENQHQELLRKIHEGTPGSTLDKKFK